MKKVVVVGLTQIKVTQLILHRLVLLTSNSISK